MNNREAMNARNRAWQKNHPEQCRKQRAKWQRENRDYYLAIRKQWNVRNKERLKAKRDAQTTEESRRRDAVRNKRYRADHPELTKQRAAEWRKANPEAGRDAVNRWRINQRSVPGSHTKQEWIELCAAFDNRCVCCGAAGPLTRDHIIPLTRAGASDSIAFIQPLCLSCNSTKGNRSAIDYRSTPFTRNGITVVPLSIS